MFQGLFNYDNPVWRFIGRLADMMLLNLLWLLCCLPVFTIGASTTALYYCTMKIVREEDNGVIRMFFKSFKENFRQAVCLFLLMLLVGLLLLADHFFFFRIFRGPRPWGTLFHAVILMLTMLWLIVFLYLWPVLARFENSLWRTLKNALLLAVGNLGFTILMLLLDGALILVSLSSIYWIPILTPLLFLIGYPAVAWLNSAFFEKIFARLIPKEERGEELRPILENWKEGDEPREDCAEDSSLSAALRDLKRGEEEQEEEEL